MISRSIISFSRRTAKSISTSSFTTSSSASQLPIRSFPHLSTTTSLRSFATSNLTRSAGQADSELIGKLEAEIGYEAEVQSTKEPDWLKALKADGTFSISDVPGSDEIKLTRTFGNEKIRVLLSCSDIEHMDEDEIELEEFEGEKEQVPSSRVRTAVSIVKPGKGGMVIDASTDGSAFDIDNVSFYDDENMALDESSENDWKRRGLYIGPTFMDLDEELQSSFTQFLDERGIGSELAAVVANLAEYKEQKEYVSWLGKMSKFIKA